MCHGRLDFLVHAKMKRLLKILIIPGPPPRGEIFHGLDRYLDALTGGIEERVQYIDVEDIQFARGGQGKGGVDAGKAGSFPRVRIRSVVPSHLRLLLGYIRDVWRLMCVLRPYRSQVDLIHVNRVGCEIQTIAARLAGFRRIVATIHNLPGETEKHNWVCRLVERLSFACGDVHIAVSEATYEAWSDRVGLRKKDEENKGKCITIYNGLEPQILSGFDRRAYRQQFCEDPDHTFIIGICARLHRMKGHVVLLEAFASLLKERLLSCRGVELLSKSPVVSLILTTKQPNNPTTIPLLLIAGAGPERHNIEAKIAELGIGNYVRLLGHRNDAEQFTASLDLNVLPSVDLETLGYSVVEAMFHGVPSIVSDVGGMKELVRASGSGLVVQAGNVQAWIKGLREYQNDPVRCHLEGVAAKVYAQNNLTAHQMADKTLKIYEAVAR